MLGWRSSGLSADALRRRRAETCANGVSRKTSSPTKNAAEAEQHGGRVRGDLARAAAGEEQDRRSTTAISSNTHSSSEPSCEDQIAVAR